VKTKYAIVIYRSEQDGCFLAEFPELPSLITDGITRTDALRNAESMIDDYVPTARQEGWPLPEPKGRLAFA